MDITLYADDMEREALLMLPDNVYADDTQREFSIALYEDSIDLMYQGGVEITVKVSRQSMPEFMADIGMFVYKMGEYFDAEGL